VGARWGFPDGATFNRAFRAFYGLPPGEYRALRQSPG
jgi:AraC-like DNA-binding protein